MFILVLGCKYDVKSSSFSKPYFNKSDLARKCFRGKVNQRTGAEIYLNVIEQ